MIVFDTSTLFNAAVRRGSIPHRALQKALKENTLARSGATYDEIIDVLRRTRLARFLTPAFRDGVISSLTRDAVWFKPLQVVADCRDVKDDKYLELALTANASIIVSSDDDLLVLHPWRGVRILRPIEYLGS